MRIRNLNELVELLNDIAATESGSTEVEVHFQNSYPLKSSIANVRMLDGKLVLALGGNEEYGSHKAWQEECEDEEEEEDCY